MSHEQNQSPANEQSWDASAPEDLPFDAKVSLLQRHHPPTHPTPTSKTSTISTTSPTPTSTPTPTSSTPTSFDRLSSLNIPTGEQFQNTLDDHQKHLATLRLNVQQILVENAFNDWQKSDIQKYVDVKFTSPSGRFEKDLEQFLFDQGYHVQYKFSAKDRVARLFPKKNDKSTTKTTPTREEILTTYETLIKTILNPEANDDVNKATADFCAKCNQWCQASNVNEHTSDEFYREFLTALKYRYR